MISADIWFNQLCGFREYFFQNFTRKKGIASSNHINILILAKCDSNWLS